ncbi:MAG TPA: arginine--tRNA ligase [Kofleriaceae bacterium]|nr:arginine--tRNA ligase [Kofleriaceae bacterium]
MSHLTPIHANAADAVAALADATAADLKVDATPRPELGDFAVGAFALAKQRGTNPAELAKQWAAKFSPTPFLQSATAAGPFINFRANRPAVFQWLIGAALEGTLVPRSIGAGQTIVIDYSSPNVSKHLAYHHIRSTMIGHALVQIFRALGYTVVGINHLGDWGTTHGKLIAAWKKWGPVEPVDVGALNALYSRFVAEAKLDPTLDDEGRGWFKRLEDGDAEALALWSRFKEVSLAEYQTVYDLLGVKYEVVKGESEYVPDIARIMQELAAKGLSSESQGAIVVAFPDEKVPLLLTKRDGATVYATRDIPSAEFRWNTWHFARSLYVVDRGQSLHFKLLFKTLKAMGREWAARCEHIPFGLVQIGKQPTEDDDPDAEKKYEKSGSRKGNVILLKQVVGEAESRVRALLAEINPELTGAALDTVANQVGLGAVLFANLVSQRDKDVKFEWDRVIALTGDSGAYVQYSHARCASILRKAGGESLAHVDFTKLATDAEWAVARRLLEFPQAIVAATPKCEPHIICHYLLELAGEFSRWYTAGNGDASLRVLCDDAPTRDARLALVAAVKAVLAEGLALLGISAPDQM